MAPSNDLGTISKVHREELYGSAQSIDMKTEAEEEVKCVSDDSAPMGIVIYSCLKAYAQLWHPY